MTTIPDNEYALGSATYAKAERGVYAASTLLLRGSPAMARAALPTSLFPKTSLQHSTSDRPRMNRFSRWRASLLMAASVLVFCGCDQMENQPRYKPLAESALFADGASVRVPPAHTIPRGHLRLDDHLYAGRVNGQLTDTYPFPITRETLERGRELYDAICSVCHGRDGYGLGIVARRGFPPPPSFHSDMLRSAPAGHFFEVITNGRGAMFPYATRVDPEDRWAIIAYIRALQRSQHTAFDDLPTEIQNRLKGETR